MKKTHFALIGIVMIATVAFFYSCSKEVNINESGYVVTDTVQTKEAPILAWEKAFYPHFKWRKMMTMVSLAQCDAEGGYLCGFNIDDILNGDETCWFIGYKNYPYRVYIPLTVLSSNNADELIDSACTGAMTFHSDFEVNSQNLSDATGIDVIPAGRYPTTLTTFNGDSAVCIRFDTML